MTSHAQVEGVSRRSYAKRRGCSETAVRQRIADGTLAKALLQDGTINADLADKLLAEKVASPAVPGTLSEARRRKAAAATALLQDELTALEALVIEPAVIAKAERDFSLLIAENLFWIADEAGPKVARQPPAIAADIIDQAVFKALTNISETEIIAEPDSASKHRRKPSARMTAVELATHRANLQARKLEIRRAMQCGDLVELDPWGNKWLDRSMTVKTLITGLPYKLAPLFQAAGKAEARRILEGEISVIVSELATEAITAKELTAGRHVGRSKPPGRRAA